jgi:peptidoglycan/LPS O-acetylase OafA/YrhL
MGWIGVDLFFVLSGFLISGLLFKEYKSTEKINAVRFLIRRGFKIYPIFYTFILLTVVTKFLSGEKIPWWSLTGELLFLQNYMGRLWDHTWSLAVEEHFYIAIVILLLFLIKYGYLKKQKIVISIFVSLLLICFLERVITNIIYPSHINSYETHLRFDSLLAGVIVSYFFHFKLEYIRTVYNNHKRKMLALFILLISFTPFIDSESSFFIKTLGFTLLYTAFSLLLLLFLLDWDINQKLDKFFGKNIVSLISKTGFYSYSIYIIHLYIRTYLMQYIETAYPLPEKINFTVYFIVSIIMGMFVSTYLEIPILKFRDKYFPSAHVTHLRKNHV